MFALHKAHEALKKENSELECQEQLLDQLIELVTFMDNFVSQSNLNTTIFTIFLIFFISIHLKFKKCINR